jgi:hypothetical protein
VSNFRHCQERVRAPSRAKRCKHGFPPSSCGDFTPCGFSPGQAIYVCHRLSNIERTSGATESWLHLAQFGCLAVVLACGTLLQINAVVFAVMVGFVLAHSVLSFIDVSYTDGRRRIQPIEQVVHGFMDVLPLVGVALIGVVHWTEIRTASAALVLHAATEKGRILFLSSFLLLGGLPIAEELLRTLRGPGRSG